MWAPCRTSDTSADDHSGRRRESIAILVANGQSNREIAATLAVTEDAIKGQIRSIFAKLGANDRTHAVVIGLKRGIIEY